MAKLTRRESREVAFALLFEWSFKDETLDEIIENAVESREIVVDGFARELAGKVIENREELDSLIERFSLGWKLQRISKTALAVLRMSFCELTKFDGIPVGASINEAVELVKKFGSDEEASYLNGILGNFEKVRKGQKQAPPMRKRVKNAEAEPPKDAVQTELEASLKDKPKEVQDVQKIQKKHDAHNTPKIQQEHEDVELVEDIVIEVE